MQIHINSIIFIGRHTAFYINYEIITGNSYHYISLIYVLFFSQEEALMKFFSKGGSLCVILAFSKNSF